MRLFNSSGEIPYQSVLIVLLVLSVVICVFVIDSGKGNVELGQEVVLNMYDFQTAFELNDNMAVLKELCSEEVFEELTLDNRDRTLQTYLKFKNEPVSVNIIESTDSYVLYSLDTKHISPNRKFILLYEVNNGKVVKVREMECIDFNQVNDNG